MKHVGLGKADRNIILLLVIALSFLFNRLDFADISFEL